MTSSTFALCVNLAHIALSIMFYASGNAAMAVFNVVIGYLFLAVSIICNAIERNPKG